MRIYFAGNLGGGARLKGVERFVAKRTSGRLISFYYMTGKNRDQRWIYNLYNQLAEEGEEQDEDL